jgi:hypothetical protein
MKWEHNYFLTEAFVYIKMNDNEVQYNKIEISFILISHGLISWRLCIHVCLKYIYIKISVEA